MVMYRVQVQFQRNGNRQIDFTPTTVTQPSPSMRTGFVHVKQSTMRRLRNRPPVNTIINCAHVLVSVESTWLCSQYVVETRAIIHVYGRAYAMAIMACRQFPRACT